MLDPTSREDAKFKDLQKVCSLLPSETLSAFEINPVNEPFSKSIECHEKPNYDKAAHLMFLLGAQVLIDWINNELEEERIIVKNLEEDLYDGQVLQKLFGKIVC